MQMRFIDAETLTPEQAVMASRILTNFARWAAKAVSGAEDQETLHACVDLTLELVMLKWLEDAANGRITGDSQKAAFLDFCAIYGKQKVSRNAE